MFLEQLTEVVGVVISHAQGNVLYAGILLLVKQKPGLFHPDFDQVVDRGVAGFAFENFGYVKRAQVHIPGDLIQGYFFIVVAVQVVYDLLYHVFFVGGFKFIAFFYGDRRNYLFAVEQEDHLGDVGLKHEVASRLAAGAFRLDEGAEARQCDEGLLAGADEAFVAGKEDLVAFHVPDVYVRKGYVKFLQRGFC